jgi:uncharacterized protein YbjT (DUF2867 family)
VILVAGGTGRLGSLLVGRLVERGLSVRVLTRDPSRVSDALAAKVDVVGGDVRHPAAVVAAVAGATVVVSAVQGLTGRHGSSPATVDRDGNRHLVDAARATGADVVLMFVVGAAADSPVELFRMKRKAEEYLETSGAGYTIVQASAFLELWLDTLGTSAAHGGRPVILGHGDVRRNYVSVRDVAALLDVVVTDPASRGQTLQIVGPDNLTLNELAAALQDVAGRSGSPRHVPAAVMRLAAGTLGRVVPAVGRVLRTSLVLDQVDLTAAPNDVREAYPGVPCTSLEACLAR